MQVAIIEKKSQRAVWVIGQSDGAEIILQELTGFASPRWNAQPLGDGTYKISSSHANGRVWDVVQASHDEGERLVMWGWHGGPNQRFRIDGEHITAVHSGKKIGVTAYQNGAALIQVSDGQASRFRVTASSITSMHSQKVLDVPWASTDSGVQLCQFGFHGGPNQRFLLEEVSNSFDYTYYRIVAEHSGKVLDVKDASKENGAPIIQWPWHGGENQKFHITGDPNGGFRITNVRSRLVLDVSGWGTDDGVPIIQWQYHGGANQRWNL